MRQLGLGQSGRHDYGCGAGTRARWRLTSVVGCHRVDQESTGAARAPIAPRHIFAGVHFVGGSRMRRPRQVVLVACCIVCRSFNVPSVTGGPTSSGWGSLVKLTPHPGLRMDGDSASTRRHGHPPGRCRCSGRLSLPHHTHRHDRVGRGSSTYTLHTPRPSTAPPPPPRPLLLPAPPSPFVSHVLPPASYPSARQM